MKLKIAVKTALAVAIAAVLLLVMLIYMVVSLQNYRGDFHAEAHGFEDVEALEDARLVWTNMRTEDIGLLTRLQSGYQSRISQSDSSVTSIETSLGKLEADVKKLETSKLSPKQQEILAAMKAAVAEYSKHWQTLKSQAAEEGEQTAAAVDDFAKWQSDHGFLFNDKARAFLDSYRQARQVSADARGRNATLSLIFSVVILVIGAIILYVVSRRIRVPLTRAAKVLSEGINQLSAGDFTVEVPRESSDEVGDMSEDFNGAMSRMRESIKSTVTSAEEVVGVTSGISQGSKEAVESAQKGADYINSGAAAAEQVSRSIQTVAAGAEEMSASIKEISSNANSAAGVAKEASEVAAQTNETVAKLGESSKEIGEVIETITAVAEQTNLLALNATIEAARAGEAGRGFAVVASEVKDLAAETGKATEEVAIKVQQIQTDTQSAVEAIEEISKIIASINDYQTTIAAAVEEQTATTNEMSRSVSEAADSSQTIADNVSHIAKQTNDLAEKFTKVDGRMGGLSDQSKDLAARLNALKY